MATYNGTNNDDDFSGTTGDDTFNMNVLVKGRDGLYGDAGIDTLNIDYSSINLFASISTIGFDQTGGFGGEIIGSYADYIVRFGGIEKINLILSAGNDELRVDPGAPLSATQTLNLNGGGGSDKINLDFRARDNTTFTVAANGTITTNIPGLTLSSFEVFQVIVGGGTNTLTGGDGNDVLGATGGINTINGGNGNDILGTSNGVGTLNGGTGNDRFGSENSVDTINGGADQDSWQGHYAGSTSNLTFNYNRSTGTGSLTGGTTLTSIENVEYLETGSGNDSFTITGMINGELHAGGGVDSLVATGINDNNYSVVSADGQVGGNTFSGGFYFREFEQVDITQTSGDDRISLIPFAGGGAVKLDGGAGDDFIDLDFTHAGATTFTVNADNSITWNAVGITNVTFVNYERYQVSVGDSYNVIHLGSGNDFINGGSGGNEIFGGAGNDRIVTGDGDDIIDPGAGDDLVNALGGIDTVTYASATSAVVFALGSFSQQSTGGSGIDALSNFENAIGSAFNDMIGSSAGDNVMDGGAGIDTVSYSEFGPEFLSGVTVNLSITTQQDTGGGGKDTIKNFENLRGSRFGDDLTGDTAANTISGYDGDDIIDGGDGKDTFYGGLGNDTFYVDRSDEQVFEDAGADTGIDLVITRASYALPSNVENLTLAAGAGAISGIGNTLANTIIGNASDNQLQGGGGDDRLYGGGGADLLYSGTGNDSLSGGDGNDGFYFGAAMTVADQADGGTGSDQLGLQGNYIGGTALTFGANATVGIEALILLPGSDSRFGDTSGAFYSYAVTTVDANVGAGQQLIVNANTLRAGENVTFNGAAELDGAFLTYGGLGNDNLTGGQKVDGFFFGDGGRFGAGDVVDGQGQQAGGLDQLGLQGNYTGGSALTFGANQIKNIEMIVLLSGVDVRFGGTGGNFSYNLTMNDGNVGAGQKMIVNANTLLAAEAVTFNGGAETNGFFQIFSGNGDDSYIGSQGNDDIWGGGGADAITGGLGVDTLHGGTGNDSFRYTSTAQSVSGQADSILDFATGDKIDLSAIDAVTGGSDNAFSFIGSAAFVNNGVGQLQAINNGGGSWTVSADVNGNGTADLVLAVTVTDAHNLTAADFVL